MDYQSFQTCQVGDVGVSLVVEIVDADGTPVDLRSATSRVIRVGYPDGTSEDFDAEFLTDGGDGKLVRTTVEGDVSEAGEYQIQGIVTLGGATRSSTVSAFQALENIPAPVEPEP